MNKMKNKCKIRFIGGYIGISETKLTKCIKKKRHKTGVVPHLFIFFGQMQNLTHVIMLRYLCKERKKGEKLFDVDKLLEK
jgi:hypothetical protein